MNMLIVSLCFNCPVLLMLLVRLETNVKKHLFERLYFLHVSFSDLTLGSGEDDEDDSSSSSSSSGNKNLRREKSGSTTSTSTDAMATKRALFPDEPDHVLEFIPLPVANHTPLTHKAGMFVRVTSGGDIWAWALM